MQFIFADDATIKSPTRPGMRPLIALGGVWVHHDQVADLERSLEQICKSYGFPPHEEFKWSPPRGCWMWGNLRDEARRQFFVDVLQCSVAHNVRANIVVVDKKAAHASRSAKSAEDDAIILFIERVGTWLRSLGDKGIVIVDRPGGGVKEERTYLGRCKHLLVEGSEYVEPSEIAINVLCGDSDFIRILQLADVVTSCTTAYVAGESTYSPTIANAIRPLLFSHLGSVGGSGVKIHPDFRYLNLYHWLFGDTTKWYVRYGIGEPLPDQYKQYSQGPDQP